MSGADHNSAFGVETLSTMVRTFDTEAHDTFFSNLFRKTPITAIGDKISWDEVTMDRDLAPVTDAESPAPRVKNTDRTRKDAYCATITLYTDIAGRRLYKERGPGQLLPNAEETIANEIQNLRLKIQKTINWIAVQMLLGEVNIDPVNLPGQEFTIPTIRTGVSTYTRANSWANSGTKILSTELQELVSGKQGYVATAGRLPGLAIINGSVEGHLIRNEEVREWVKSMFGGFVALANPAARVAMGGLSVGGLAWKKSVSGFVPSNKPVFTPFMPDGVAIVLPPEEELGEILSMAEGYGIIPKNAFGVDTANGVVEQAPKPGFYSYATAIENPPGVRIYVGWLGLPVIKFPKAVCVAKVA
jgi:hypothetical protein